MKSVLDVKNPITESRRKFLNHVTASEDSWIATYEWDRCFRPEVLGPGEKITLGFDGSSNDWTAFVACRVSDGALFLLKHWNPAILLRVRFRVMMWMLWLGQLCPLTLLLVCVPT